MGLKSYPDLASLPAPPELVVIVVDLARMPEILDEMARLGCHNALIVSGGGKELGGGRAELERTIALKARELESRSSSVLHRSFDGATVSIPFSKPRAPGASARGPDELTSPRSGHGDCVFLGAARINGVSKMESYEIAWTWTRRPHAERASDPEPGYRQLYRGTWVRAGNSSTLRPMAVAAEARGRLQDRP